MRNVPSPDEQPNRHSQRPAQWSQGDYRQPQSNAYQPPQQYPPQQQPYGYQQPQAYYPPPAQPPARRRPDKRTVTVQSGSNGFHIFMTVITGGLWLIIWPLFRRKVRVTTRYR